MLLAKKIAAWLAVVLFAAATAVALLQPVYPDPFRPKVGLDRFLYPTETNAFTRLPSITTSLNDLEIKVGADRQAQLWAVGSGGAILHSPDGGRCWEAQGLWARANARPACGPRDLWDRMELIPTAWGGQAAPTQTPIQEPISATLKPGKSSPEVPRWRSALREAGYDTGEAPADPETYDKGMASAVAAFQHDKGLAADGLIGNQTRVLLETLPSPSAGGMGSKPIDSEPIGAVSQSGQEPPAAEAAVVPPPDLNAVDFLDAQTGWAVGPQGTILKTTNGGARWDTQTSGTDQSLLAVQFLDAQNGWAVGSSGTILKTINGGARWDPQTSGTDQLLLAVQFLDAQTGWAVGDSGTILKTMNGGARWDPQTGGTNQTLFAVQFLDAQTGWAVGHSGTILKTTNGGARWDPQTSGTNEDLSAVQFLDAQTGWTVGSNGAILKTTNGGARWDPQTSSTDQTFYAVQFLDAQTCWAVGLDGTILKTTNGGTRWDPQTSGTNEDLSAVQFLDAQTGWAVGRDGTILKTTNGGARWDPQTSGTHQWLSAVQFLDAQTGWTVGLWGTILKTTDGSATWSPQASGIDASLNAVQFLDAQTGWAAGSEGTILKTTDGGARWKSPLAPYSIGFAPWYWGACLLSIALLGFSAWPQRPEVTERSVADLLASDRPLRNKSEADALDLGVIAASLSEFLRNRHTEAPLTIAVTGDWGSGKTSLMNLLRQDLMEKRFRPVWFNAWHHQKGEQILASLFAHIREQSIPPLTSWRGLRFRWRLLVRRGVPVWLPVTLLLFVLAVLLGYLWEDFPVYAVSIWDVLRDPEQLWHKDWQTLTKLFTVLAGIGGSILGLVHTLQGFGLDPKKLVTVNPENRKTQGLDPGARARFTREFRDVTECLKPRKMVIFIDDLDRCSQQSLIEVLEAINFLASSGDCFILMGMSPGWVEACVGLEYEHLARAMAEELPDGGDADKRSAEQRRRFARNYLEKLINIQVPIPDLKQDRAGVLITPPEPRGEGGRKRFRTSGLLADARSLSAIWKPVVLALVSGYGLWFGHDLLNKWEKKAPPPAVSWTSSRVPLSLMTGDGEQNPAAVSGGEPDQTPTSPESTAGGRGPKAEVAGGKLARTLSDLLGVEISIQANPEAIKKGLVLLESGEEGSGWRVVLGEPKQETTPGPATGGGTTDNGKSEPKPPETEKRPFELKPGSMAHGALPAWALILTALVLVITAWRSSRRSALEITADSKDFQEALRIWLPWLMAKQATPRSVKRFVNWLRYIAVRLRKAAGMDESRFPETNTVALAAIHYLNPEWLTSDSLYEMVTGCMITALLKPGEGMAAQMDEQQVDKLAVSLANCIGTYAEWMGTEGLSEEERRRRGEWIPSAEHRDAFLAVISEKAAVS